MRPAVYAALTAFVTGSLAGSHGGEEKVTVSGLSIHVEGSPVGDTIESIEFRLNGASAKNLKCFAKDFAFPEPVTFHSCGKSDYSFTLWPGGHEVGVHGQDFRVMIYHDVGDSQGSGPADEICTQKKSVTFEISGPVGIGPDL
ncbi:major allergen alt [Fusarium heterosporum]|uniref:Major allergen alt n=1 Tax=Fusarium heterosporum TaxID=42747 RepID=A0A8H5SW70_FUSHE|nr:major allergen alt [Fusarium heterosporum]